MEQTLRDLRRASKKTAAEVAEDVIDEGRAGDVDALRLKRVNGYGECNEV